MVVFFRASTCSFDKGKAKGHGMVLVSCRGMNLESLMSKLRHAIATQQAVPELQLIAMSATMGGLEGLCNWLDAVRQLQLDCALVLLPWL
jgi:replicative superfamily II helicase